MSTTNDVSDVGARASGNAASRTAEDFPASSPFSKEPYTQEAQRRGVLPFREFVCDLRAGVKLSKAERIRCYGTATAPAPVPLFRGETEEEYEQKYQKWLKARGIMTPLTAVQELSIRSDFASRRAMWHRGDPRMMTLHPDRNPSLAGLSIEGVERKYLCETEYVRLNEYKLWLKFGFFEQLKTLSPTQIYDRFDRVLPPIYAPFASGETPEMYEERFVKWLRNAHSKTLEELAGHEDRLEERKYRIKFATLVAKGTQKFVPPPKAKRMGDTAKGIEPLAKRTKISRDEELEEGEVMEGDEQQTEKLTLHSLKTEPQPHPQPKSACPGRDSIEACINCGCEQCIVRGSQLLRKFEAAKSSDSKTPAPTPASVIDSITRLVLSRPSPEDLHSKIAHRLSASAKDRVQATVDPIEVKLMREYNVINTQAVVTERELESTQLALASGMHPEKTNQRLEENRQRQELIRTATVRLHSAFSALCVYLWWHDMTPLIAIVNDPQSTNVGRGQRVGHLKCGMLSSQIKKKRLRVEELKAKLAYVMANELSDGSDFEATNEALAKLGTLLRTAEGELVQLQEQRKEEFMTVIRSDERVRHEIQQFLPKT